MSAGHGPEKSQWDMGQRKSAGQRLCPPRRRRFRPRHRRARRHHCLRPRRRRRRRRCRHPRHLLRIHLECPSAPSLVASVAAPWRSLCWAARLYMPGRRRSRLRRSLLRLKASTRRRRSTSSPRALCLPPCVGLHQPSERGCHSSCPNGLPCCAPKCSCVTCAAGAAGSARQYCHRSPHACVPCAQL